LQAPGYAFSFARIALNAQVKEQGQACRGREAQAEFSDARIPAQGGASMAKPLVVARAFPSNACSQAAPTYGLKYSFTV
jgi:hypothetical protein